MFLQIDSKIITLVQWLVRQCELYTSVLRKKIIELTLSSVMMSIIMIISSLLLVILFADDKVDILVSVFLIGWNIFLFTDLYRNMLGLTKKNTPANSLPQEIITRMLPRLILLTGLLTLFLLVIILEIYLPIKSNAHLFFRFYEYALCSVLSFSLFFEYLLCTTSLPPGEKQRREEEKEMRNMIPQKF